MKRSTQQTSSERYTMNIKWGLLAVLCAAACSAVPMFGVNDLEQLGAFGYTLKQDDTEPMTLEKAKQSVDAVAKKWEDVTLNDFEQMQRVSEFMLSWLNQHAVVVLQSPQHRQKEIFTLTGIAEQTVRVYPWYQGLSARYPRWPEPTPSDPDVRRTHAEIDALIRRIFEKVMKTAQDDKIKTFEDCPEAQRMMRHALRQDDMSAKIAPDVQKMKESLERLWCREACKHPSQGRHMALEWDGVS